MGALYPNSLVLISVAITVEGSLPLPFFTDVLARDRTGDTLTIELDSVHKVHQICYSIYRMYPALGKDPSAVIATLIEIGPFLLSPHTFIIV